MMIKEEYFDDVLNEDDLCLLETQWHTNKWTPMTTGSHPTLLSPTSDNLPNTESTYQVVGEDGMIYSSNMTKEELERYIAKFSKDMVKPVRNGVGYFDLLNLLVEQLRNDGYRLFAHKRQKVDTWRVIDMPLLVAHMEAQPQIHPFITFSRVDDDGDTYLVDEQGAVVMRRNKEEFYDVENNEIFYSIHDKHGDLILSEIPKCKILVILFCFISHYDVTFIQNNFLRFKDQKTQPIVYDEMNFINYIVSPNINVRSYTDLTMIYRLVINESKPIYSGSYYMWNTQHEICCLTYPISQNELVTTINARGYIEETDQDKLFSDYIISMAERNGLEIERQDACESRRLFVNQLIYENEKIINYVNTFLFGDDEESFSKSATISPVFRLREIKTNEYLLQNCDIYELLTYLFGYDD